MPMFGPGAFRRLRDQIRNGLGIIAADPLAGATGIWVASDYESTPRKRIKNRVTNGTADSNLLAAPRRMFSESNYWTIASIGAGNTLVDANATGPDGSANTASTITAAGTADWQLKIPSTTLTVTNGTYTVAISAKVASGSGDFQLGHSSTGMQTFTATGTWQRFVKTVTITGGSIFPLLRGPGTLAAGTLLIADFQLFAGGADLNATPLTAVPLSMQNMDLMLGTSHYDSTINVTGGFIVNGSRPLLQMASSFPAGNFTAVFVAKRAAAGTNAAFQAFLSNAAVSSTAYQQLTLGYGNSAAGAYYAGQKPWTLNTGGIQTYPELWHKQGDGVFVSAMSYDGTTFSEWENGMLVAKVATTIAAPTVRDFAVGYIRNVSFLSGLDIAAMAIFPTAKTSAEVVAIQNALLTASAQSIPSTNLLMSFGTSLTAGNKGKPYPYHFVANATKPVFGWDAGQSGANWPTIKANMDVWLNGLAAYSYPATNIVVSIEAGTNDLGGYTTGTVSNLADDIATRCDLLRSLGFKVVIHTITPRNDGSQAATFNPVRNVYNGIIRNWVGTGTGKHVDALVDIGLSTSGMGADGDYSNTSYFDADQCHPVTNGYTTIWEPPFRTAVNPLLV